MPDCVIARAVVRHAGAPVTATSANLSGQSPAASIMALSPIVLNGIDAVLEGGPSPATLPSTIVDISGEKPRLIREGAIPRDAFEEIIPLSVDHDS